MLIKGVSPNNIPKFGRIDETTKKLIPIKSPIIIRLLVWVDLNLPKMNGSAKKSIIAAEKGWNIFAQNIFFCIFESKLFFSR